MVLARDLQQLLAFISLTVQSKGGHLQRFPENGPCTSVSMPGEDRAPCTLTSLPFADSFAPWVREANLAGPSWSLGKSTPSKAYTTTKLCQKIDFGPSS